MAVLTVSANAAARFQSCHSSEIIRHYCFFFLVLILREATIFLQNASGTNTEVRKHETSPLRPYL